MAVVLPQLCFRKHEFAWFIVPDQTLLINEARNAIAVSLFFAFGFCHRNKGTLLCILAELLLDK